MRNVRFELLHLLFLENFLQLQNFFSKQRFVLFSFSAFMTHTDFSCDIFTTDLAQNSFRRIAAPLHGQPMSGKLSVADSGEGPAPPQTLHPHPLIFRPTGRPKGRNNFFLTGDAHPKSPTTTGNEAV